MLHILFGETDNLLKNLIYFSLHRVANQTVTGQITLLNNVSFANINISSINQVNLDDFLAGTVLVTGNYTFNESVTFVNGITAEQLHVSGENLVVKTINELSIKDLHENTLKTVGEQSLCCVQTENVTIGNLTVTYLNNLRIPEDLMTKNTSQFVTGIFNL